MIFDYLNGGLTCIICGRKTFFVPVCKYCETEYFSVSKAIKRNRCKFCGKVLISTKESCLQCRESYVLTHVDLMMPLFSYRLWNKELMFLWKSLEFRALSGWFGKITAETLRKMNVEVIVPVPPRPGKIKEKGWDQIDELCKFLKYKYGFKVLDILERHSMNQQKKLDRENRLESIGKAYFLKSDKEIKKELKSFHGSFPKSVCLVDDVCTTGATIESCAEVLKSAGVVEVKAFTIFMVD